MKHKVLFKKRISQWILLLSASALILSSCETEPSTINSLREVCFNTEILPIMQNSCATLNCHDVSARHGYRLDSYQGIMSGIEPGNPGRSKVYQAIINTGEERMPPESPLSAESRMLIRVWIEQGAMETICKDSINLPPIDTTTIDTSTIEEPWSNPFACFERDILPVMASSCGITGCHDPISNVEEFDFTNYAGILEGLIPGNPESSKIYKSISEVEQSDLMPPLPYSRLPQAQIDTIYNWIKRGALNEDCGNACDTTDIRYSTHLADLLATSCISCHSGSFPQGGVSLENYNHLIAAANSGAVPAVLRATGTYSLMPPSGPLSECNIKKFEIWITNGMPE